MRLLRHTDEWVGLLVIATMAVLIVAGLQAGVVRDWFRPTSTLRIVLPETGVAGLEVGASVEVLGTRAGTIRRIVLDPRQQLYASAEIEDQAIAFIRRDSVAVIRRQFGIAGAAYVDLSRGTGQPMDWTYAVLNATTERAPTDVLSELIDQAQKKIIPILDDAGRATHAVAVAMERSERGEGDIGHLLKDETLAHDMEDTVRRARASMTTIQQTIVQLDQAAHDVAGLAQSVRGKAGVPALLQRADQALASLQGATKDLAQASARTPSIARNIDAGAADLPALLTQTQLTAQQLEALLTQLRGLWLLGGGDATAAPPRRLSPADLHP